MRRFFANRPSPAMAVAFIALLAALSGTAVALPGTNSVDSGDIKNKQVKNKDLANNAVTGRKIKNSAVRSADVGNDSLTGADINEGTLGQVPSAASAATANGVAPGSVGTAGLADAAVTGAKLASDSVGSSQVSDGSLAAADISTFNATGTFDFPSLAAGVCDRRLVTIAGSGDTSNDSVLVTADAGDLILAPSGGGFNLVVLGQGSNAADAYRVVVCNPSEAAVDPPNSKFYVTAFQR